MIEMERMRKSNKEQIESMEQEVGFYMEMMHEMKRGGYGVDPNATRRDSARGSCSRTRGERVAVVELRDEGSNLIRHATFRVIPRRSR